MSELDQLRSELEEAKRRCAELTLERAALVDALERIAFQSDDCDDYFEALTDTEFGDLVRLAIRVDTIARKALARVKGNDK